MPDYAEFDGTPYPGDHADFRFDAWRAASNVAVDYAWFAADDWAVEQSNRLLGFFQRQGIGSYANQFTPDGKPLSSDHSPGLVAMNAVVALPATSDKAGDFVDELWNSSIPAGKWRYYDGMLYTLALLHVSGNFRIYPPANGALRIRLTPGPPRCYNCPCWMPDTMTDSTNSNLKPATYT